MVQSVVLVVHELETGLILEWGEDTVMINISVPPQGSLNWATSY